MQKKISILLIEDNQDIQEAVGLIFDVHWPQVELHRALTGVEGIALMRSESPDLAILDLGLPDIDGLKVLREIRSFSNTPVIILTVRGEQMDKIRGLELGADDFIVKPFAHKELLARIKSVLSRTSKVVAEQDEQQPVMPKTVIDFNTGEVIKGEQQFKLGRTELNLLKYLASNDGKVVSDSQILITIWGEEYVDCAEYLQAYIRSLREKLEEDPDNPQIIITDADGYKFQQIAG
ncbi:MAG: response regulator transcription factor [Dehalococcoidia bacterium]|nr:response regulator transcription factor [Dehalococcoidia bacterium]MDD5494082.1 response regulator transcription factor [Dehalococcoidia bacterium]